MSGTLSMGTNPITNVTETLYTSNATPDTPPTSGLAVYTSGNLLNYKDQTGTIYTLSTSVAGGYLPLAGGTMTGSIAMGASNLTNVGNISGATNSRPADNIVSNTGTGVSGNIASLSGTTGKVITDSGVVATSVVIGPTSVVSGNLAVFSSTTGKLLADGGAALNAYLPLAGGTMSGPIAMGSNAVTGTGANSAGSYSASLATASTTPGTGAIVSAGGLGVAGAGNFGGSITAVGATLTGPLAMGSNAVTGTGANSAGSYSASLATASTTTGTGAIVSAGGLGVAGAMNIGGNIVSGTNQTRILDTKLTMQGNVTNITGPHITAYTTNSQYPAFQQLNWNNDNIALSFDSYYSGSAWTSSLLGSNYQIQKTSNQLQFNYSSAFAPGSTLAWTVAGYVDTSGILQWQKAIKTFDTTVSSSKTTGSIVAAGGLGVAGAGNFGGKVTISSGVGIQGFDTATGDVYANMRIIQNTTGSDKDIYIGYGSPAGSNVRLYSSGNQTVYVNNGNTVVGAAVAAAATDGFLYIPTVPATKTGTPTTYTGTVPMVFDTSVNRLVVYVGGSWKSVGPFV